MRRGDDAASVPGVWRRGRDAYARGGTPHMRTLSGGRVRVPSGTGLAQGGEACRENAPAAVGRQGEEGNMKGKRDKKAKVRRSQRITIIVQAPAVAMLDALLKSGLYGRSRADIVERLLAQGLQRVISDISKQGTGNPA